MKWWYIYVYIFVIMVFVGRLEDNIIVTEGVATPGVVEEASVEKEDAFNPRRPGFVEIDVGKFF
jgi:uncharacterized membrane protein